MYSLTTTKAPTQEVTYACLLRSGKAVQLNGPTTPRGPASIEHVALAGTIVAYAYSTHGVDSGSTGIAVMDAATRHRLLAVPRVGGFVDACVISFREVTDLVVTSRGSVAWIVREGSGCKTSTFQVFSALVAGAPDLLEEGPKIAAKSLRVSHRTVTWENAGQRRSAQL